MNTFLSQQYDNLRDGHTISEINHLKTIPPDLQDKIAQIPPLYLIGSPPIATPLIVAVAQRIKDAAPDLVIEIGSGKGYLARLLGNFHQLKVLCVDSNQERLQSSIRWDRLMNDSQLNSTNTPLKISGKNVSRNIKTLNMELNTLDDFNVVLKESQIWSRNLSNTSQLMIVAIKNCGDMIYDLIDYCTTMETTQFTLIVIPCCYDKCQKFPQSQQLKDIELNSELIDRTETMYLMDMMYFAENKGLQVTILREFDRFFSFTITPS